MGGAWDRMSCAREALEFALEPRLSRAMHQRVNSIGAHHRRYPLREPDAQAGLVTAQGPGEQPLS